MLRFRTASLALSLSLATLSLPAFAADGKPAAAKLEVSVYAAKEANVNAFVFSDGAGTILFEATRNATDAAALAALARSKGKEPHLLIVSHGHPDHFFGMGTLRQEFPKMRIAVASEAIKADILWLSGWLAENGYMEKLPGMKPKSEKNPEGFDYAKELTVLEGPTVTMPGGAVLEVRSDYPASEAPHSTTIFSKDLNAFFASDLCYHGVHLWLGMGVERSAAMAWQKMLAEFAAKYGPMKTTIYPGHGKPTDATAFVDNRDYIDAFFRVIDGSKDEAEAKAKLTALYPGRLDVEFLMAESVKFQMAQKNAPKGDAKK